jgi:hypothetical protein
MGRHCMGTIPSLMVLHRQSTIPCLSVIEGSSKLSVLIAQDSEDNTDNLATATATAVAVAVAVAVAPRIQVQLSIQSSTVGCRVILGYIVCEDLSIKLHVVCCHSISHSMSTFTYSY